MGHWALVILRVPTSPRPHVPASPRPASRVPPHRLTNFKSHLRNSQKFSEINIALSMGMFVASRVRLGFWGLSRFSALFGLTTHLKICV
jgi:hypothetical protein